MKFTCVLAAVVAVVLTPHVALAQQARPVLSTSMKRVCQAETTATVLVREGQTVADPMPVIERQERRLSVQETSTGLAFEHVTHSPHGTVRYHIVTSAEGAVKSAEVEGIPPEMGLSEVQLGELARNSADDLPERLMVARSFSPGDGYYPEPLRQTLIGRMMDSFGLPFPVTGSLDVFYRGEIDHAGRRGWLFDGTLTMEGSGPVQGTELGLRLTGTARVVHDVQTGLVLSYDLQMQNHVDVGGKPVDSIKSSEVWQCQIVAQ